MSHDAIDIDMTEEEQMAFAMLESRETAGASAEGSNDMQASLASAASASAGGSNANDDDGTDDAKPPAKRSRPDVEENVEPVGARAFEVNIVGHRTMMSGVDQNKQIIKFQVQFIKKIAQDDNDSSDDEASRDSSVLTISWLGLDLIGSIDPSAAIRYLESRCPDIVDWEKKDYIENLRSRRKELMALTSWKDVVDFCCHHCSCGKRRTELIECGEATIHRKCCHNLIGTEEAKLRAWKTSLQRVNAKVMTQISETNEDDGGNYGSKSAKHQEKILLEKGLKSARSRETRAINDTELADPVW